MRLSKARTRQRSARLIGLASAGYGLALLAAPDAITTRLTPSAKPDARIVRVLGARQLGQGVALMALPQRGVTTAALATDVTHGASMIALAALTAHWRRPALISGAIAFVSAIALSRSR